MFVFIGIIIFIVSFVIALVSLVREQKAAQKAGGAQGNVPFDEAQGKEPEGMSPAAAQVPLARTVVQAPAEPKVPQQQPVQPQPQNPQKPPVRDFPWETASTLDDLSKKVEALKNNKTANAVKDSESDQVQSGPDSNQDLADSDTEPFAKDSLAKGDVGVIDLSKLARKS